MLAIIKHLKPQGNPIFKEAEGLWGSRGLSLSPDSHIVRPQVSHSCFLDVTQAPHL